VAVRQSRDEHFLRVNSFLYGPLADNVRRSRCRNDRPTVKGQRVTTAVAAFGKVFTIGQLPIDVGSIGRQRFFTLATIGDCSKVNYAGTVARWERQPAAEEMKKAESFSRRASCLTLPDEQPRRSPEGEKDGRQRLFRGVLA
jgi:hypothetical protein